MGNVELLHIEVAAVATQGPLLRKAQIHTCLLNQVLFAWLDALDQRSQFASPFK